MEAISVFDMLKIGVGPSSSHTLGPWRAIQRWLSGPLAGQQASRIEIHLYGSLALTGRGHGTDRAVQLALIGEDPEHIDLTRMPALLEALAASRELMLAGTRCDFDPARDIHFHGDESLPEHPNGLRCRALIDGRWQQHDYYSIGGGFVRDPQSKDKSGPPVALPYPCQHAHELLAHCRRENLNIAALVRANERAWRDDEDINARLDALWSVMLEAMYNGCSASGELPGGLHVVRRAGSLCRQLLGHSASDYPDASTWMAAIRDHRGSFEAILRWISCFALAVNEENASFGRIVTAPTNGAAGVIPAVLMYHLCFLPQDIDSDTIRNFLMVAGELGTHFKKNATISAAAGGCQAEIGVSSAMAAAALTEARGGSVAQALMAAEIAMEHHLGMTCDPVRGLVQVPCIERNAMGAVKAINAAELALSRDPGEARVSLDEVIQTLADTARDMSSKYKETSQGGLAVNIAVNHPEC